MLLIFTLALGGFIGLSVSMKRHYVQLWPQREPLPVSKVVLLRVVCVAGFLCGLVLCVQAYGVGIGVVFFTGLVSFVAFLQALLLALHLTFIRRYSRPRSSL